MGQRLVVVDTGTRRSVVCIRFAPWDRREMARESLGPLA
jgi:hypothetical protein